MSIFEGKGVKVAETYEEELTRKLDDKKFYSAIQLMANILKETTIPKITGHLIKFDLNDVLVGKCVLGVISCETGVKLSPDNTMTDYKDILRLAGVPESWINVHFPSESFADYKLFDILVNLNDEDKDMTFCQIGEYLETNFIPEDYQWNH